MYTKIRVFRRYSLRDITLIHRTRLLDCSGIYIYIYIYIHIYTYIHTHTHTHSVQLKSGSILIRVIYLLRFTTCYITQLNCIYIKCWKWCPFISLHLSTRFTMFLTTFLSVLSFTVLMARVIFIFKILNFFKETLSTVGVRRRF